MKYKKENLNKTENLTQDPIIEKFITDILSQVQNLPEEEQEEKILENLRDIGINVVKSKNGEWKTEKENEDDEKFIQNIIDDLLKQTEHFPEEEKEKEIIKILKNKYDIDAQTLESGANFAGEIVEKEILKDEKTVEEIETIMENDKNRLPISPEITFQKEKPEEIRKIKTRNYLMELAVRYQNGFKMPQEAKRWAKKTAIILGIIGAGLAVAFGIKEVISRNSEKWEIAKDKDKKELFIKEEKQERLSENCKKVVEYFETNNPTPGKWFIVTDKDSAKNFIFDDKCILQRTVKIGLGKTKGENENTSYSLHEGNMTTPAGVYIMSNMTTEFDKKLYSKNIVLYGISVNDAAIVLGMHEYYAGEREMRIKAINNSNEKERPETARVSDGCENSSEEDMDFIFKHFKINNEELTVILPENGALIDLDKLMPKIKKGMEEFKKLAMKNNLNIN